jgi:hypothetical protein
MAFSPDYKGMLAWSWQMQRIGGEMVTDPGCHRATAFFLAAASLGSDA